MFYLTSRIFFRAKLFILRNFRLHQSKSSNLDHPKTCKINKKVIFFLCFSNEPVSPESTPPKCLGLAEIKRLEKSSWHGEMKCRAAEQLHCEQEEREKEQERHRIELEVAAHMRHEHEEKLREEEEKRLRLEEEQRIRFLEEQQKAAQEQRGLEKIAEWREVE